MRVEFLLLVIAPTWLLMPSIVMLWTRERWNAHQNRRFDRRHPISRGLLRPPGHSLGQKISELQVDAAGELFFSVLAGTVGVVVVLVIWPPSEQSYTAQLTAALTVGLALATWRARKMSQLISQLRRFRLGWEGELATGEELNQLMRVGYSVFHDLDCDKFNHVAVGPGGVYAVETKARTIQRRGGTEEIWRASYDGKVIGFAGFTSDAPITQARRNATWLREWLTSAVGEPVHVKPVVVLPGWLVERVGRSDVYVVSGREVSRMVPPLSSRSLSDKQIQQIAHQLDVKCRDLDKNKTVSR